MSHQQSDASYYNIDLILDEEKKKHITIEYCKINDSNYSSFLNYPVIKVITKGSEGIYEKRYTISTLRFEIKMERNETWCHYVIEDYFDVLETSFPEFEFQRKKEIILIRNS